MRRLPLRPKTSMTRMNRACGPANEEAPVSQIGASLESLAGAIAARRGTGSYTDSLLSGPVDEPLKKLMEEASEVALAAKDVEAWATTALASTLALESQGGVEEPSGCLTVPLPPEYRQALNHLRYEAADVVYHLMVVLERFGLPLDDLAAELNMRMTEEERPEGAVMLRAEDVERGK